MSVAEDLETLAEKADRIARKFSEPATFVVVRGALNEAGIIRSRTLLGDALDMFEHAQAAKRDADRAEREAKRALDRALAVAEWSLVPPQAEKRDGKTFVNGEEVVSWVAADKQTWKKREALKDPEVVAADKCVLDAEHETAVARDQLIAADKRLSACRADLDAAIATLNALMLALPARKPNSDD